MFNVVNNARRCRFCVSRSQALGASFVRADGILKFHDFAVAEFPADDHQVTKVDELAGTLCDMASEHANVTIQIGAAADNTLQIGAAADNRRPRWHSV